MLAEAPPSIMAVTRRPSQAPSGFYGSSVLTITVRAASADSVRVIAP